MSEEKKEQFSIKALRVDRGYTQEALATVLGVSKKTMNDLENNKIEVKQLHIFALAYILRVDSDVIRV